MRWLVPLFALTQLTTAFALVTEQTFVIPSSYRGSINNLGGYASDNSYEIGFSYSTITRRNYFFFPIPALRGGESITSARLLLASGSSAGGSLKTVSLWDIYSDIAAVSSAYDDIGSGTSYGLFQVTGNVNDVELNSAAIVGINAAAGGIFGIGGRLDAYNDSVSRNIAFAGTGATSAEDGLSTLAVTIRREDNIVPVITLNGPNPQTVYRGTAFTDLGATVTDDFDATRTITGSGTVNTATVGSYTLTYSAQDEVGNVATPVTRTVEVVLDPNGDEDNDGLNNTEEATLGTNPYLRDTDNDGVNDLREVGDGTDPLDPASFDPLSKGLVAHFDGESAVDRLRNLPSLNAKGNASMGLGLIGSSFIFDGVGAGYTMPDVEELKLNSFTVSLWFRWAGYRGETEMLVFRGGVRGGFDPFFLQVLGDGVLLAALNHGGITQASYLHSSEAVSIDTWYMAVVTFDENTKAFRLYINGRSSDAATSTSSMDRDLEPWEDPGWGIGNHSGNNGYNYPYNGSLDELRFYNRALGADEVALLFAQDKYSGFSLEGAATKSPFDPATAANWSAGGAAWAVDTAVTHDGVDSAKAQTTDGQSTYREYTVTGPAVVDFWWKVSSEKNFDTFSYSLNGVNQETMSGEVDWTYRTLTLPAGTHTIRWTYSKDDSGAIGQDAGWLDEFAVYPAAATLRVRDGATLLDSRHTVDFGSTALQGNSPTKSLTFSNEGYVPLEVQLSLPAGSPFTFDSGMLSYELLLARGESVDIPISLATDSAGTKTAIMSIVATDSDVAPPIIALQGILLGQKISVGQGGNALTPGQSINMGLAPRTLHFTISNTGNVGNLILSQISSTGNFQITQQPQTTIAPQSSTSFTVLAQAVAFGSQTGGITITSNDPDTPAFTIPLSATAFAVGGDGIRSDSMATSGSGGAVGWGFASTQLPSGATGQALKTGSTPNNGGSVLEFTSQSAGVVTWSWKVSTQEEFDWLLCEVDGQETAGISTKNGLWQTQVVNVPAGANVRWVYRKDASGTIGEDAGYLADVEFRSFAANQSFSQWAQTHGIYDPQQRMPKSGLKAMFAWLGGLSPSDPTGDRIDDWYTSPPGSGPRKWPGLPYRYPVSKTADGTQQILYSSDMTSWTTRRISQRVVSEDADRVVIEATAPSGTKGFFKVVGGGDTTSPVMALIPAGSFSMGDAFGEGGSDQRPVHTVNVSAFYMDKYEVSKALWDEVAVWAARNGYDINASSARGKAADHPVHSVTWYSMVKWCNARSQKKNLTPCYTVGGAVMKTGTETPDCNFSANGYRLPTEAEWEKAARGGLSGKRFPWGDTITHSQANYYATIPGAGPFDSFYSYDVSPTRGFHPTYETGSFPYSSPVGSFAPNGYGLYDMAGNMWEWCWDWYSSSYYASSPSSDPRGATSGSYRVVRGGGYATDAFDTRAAARRSSGPSINNGDLGFRCVRSSVP